MMSFIIVDVYTDVIGRNTEMAVVASENVNPPRKYITNIRIIMESILEHTVSRGVLCIYYCCRLAKVIFVNLNKSE